MILLDGNEVDGSPENLRILAATVNNVIRSRGHRIVFTNGVFDGLHPGHFSLLAQARAYGAVIVGVNSNESVKRIRGKAPRYTHEWRLMMIDNVSPVTGVLLFGKDTPQEVIEAIDPDVLLKGEEYKDKPVAGREYVESRRGRMIYASMVKALDGGECHNSRREP